MLLDRMVCAFFASSALLAQVVWATPKIDPSLSLSEQYSDNVGLTTTDEEDSFIHEITPGISIDDSGAKTSYFADYRYRSLTYSNSNFDDRSENSLRASANRYELNHKLNIFLNANIVNVETDIGAPRFGDGVSGTERTETITTSGGAIYNSGTLQYYELQTGINYRHTETDNDAVNVDSYSANYNLKDGTRFNNTFWSFGGDYSIDDNKNEKYTSDGLVGANITSSIGLFVQANREDNDLSNNTAFVTETWGAGVRINRAKSTLSLAYNTFEEGGQNDDIHFISASASWDPTKFTSISANYGERFFGETYGLEAKHQTRKLRQSLRYSDSVSNFSDSLTSAISGFLVCPDTTAIDINDCFIPQAGESIPLGYVVVGAQIPINSISEAEVLNRTLSYSAVYSQGKSSFSATVLWNRSKILDENFSTTNYSTQRGITLGWNWRVSARSTFIFNSSARKVDDRETAGVTSESKDFTQRVTLQRSFSPHLTGSLSYTYSDRRAQDSSGDIRENRIAASVVANF